MNDDQTGQVNRNAAEIYEEFFIPALFQEWADHTTDAARILAGQYVLDVACGTGILARTVAARVGPTGSVIGLDVNEGMLEVARRKAPEIEWKHGNAESLPFDDNTFDAVVSQFGLMFFKDRMAAIHEMSRVLRSGGRMAVTVWGRLDDSPGYASMAELLERLFGTEIAAALYAPFSLGDSKQLLSYFNSPELSEVKINTINGKARFPSIDSWVFTDIKGWTLSESINEAQYQQLLDEAEREFQPFVQADHSVQFNIPAHIVTAVKS